MDELAKFVMKDHGRLKGSRVNWESHWQETTDYIIPRKSNVFDFRTQPGGDKRHSKIYTTTAIQANEILASALQGMLTNPSTQWFSIETGIPEIDKLKHVKEWMQKSARRMVQVMNNSNFQTEIHEVYIDLGSIGTAALRIEEDKEFIVKYQARPIYEHWIRENHKGLVDGLTRELKMTGRQLKQKYNFKKIAKRLDETDGMKLERIDKDIHREWNIIHYIMPKEDVPKELIPGITRRFKWVSLHVIEELELTIDIGGFEEFPYAIPRWTKTSSEIYGRGPGMKALADIKMENEMMKTLIRYSQKVTDPPLQLPDDGIVLPLRTTPGGINYYRAGTADRITPLEMGGRPEITQAMLEDVRRRIREAFFIDQLQLNEGPQMTATEVLQRTEEKLRLMGPVLGRLHFELLKPLIERTFNIMARKDVLPPNPPGELEDLNFEVHFSSMISRAQRASEADNIQRVVGIMAPIIQAQPEILDNIDGDGLLKFVGDLFNVPHEMFRDEKEVAAVRENRQKVQAEQAQLEQQQTQASTAKDLGIQAPPQQ